jgi:hypothetical protein
MNQRRQGLPYYREEFRVEPIKEESEILLGVQAMHYTPQNVKQLHQL